MLRKVSFIFAFVMYLLLSGTSASAFSAINEAERPVDVDTTDTMGLTDSLAAALQNAFVDTTATVKVRDRGFDATRYSMMKRYTPKDFHVFENKGGFDKTFYTIRGGSQKLGTPDYSYGLMAGISFGKWYHEDHAVRFNMSMGHWYDNFNGMGIHAAELSWSYLFNVISYLGGYKPARFCNLSVVAGVGYANCGYAGNTGQALTAHAGFNIDMKLGSAVSVFVEPLAKIYSNGMAISRAGNWRSWLSSFDGSVGLAFSVGNPKVDIIDGDWFMTLVFGPQVQNSANVYDKIGVINAIGPQVNLGFGQYVTDFIGFRGTLSYSRHKWVQYDELRLFSNYFALRAEAMLDLIGAFVKDRHAVAFSLLFGPEFGYMYKDDYGEEYLDAPYIGLTGGVQLKFALSEKVGLFFEPRFSFVPYNGVSYDRTSLNDFVNYYDGLVNMNIGLEIDL